VDFDAQSLKTRGITQGCAFLGTRWPTLFRGSNFQPAVKIEREFAILSVLTLQEYYLLCTFSSMILKFMQLSYCDLYFGNAARILLTWRHQNAA